jgi:hypothetical protein
MKILMQLGERFSSLLLDVMRDLFGMAAPPALILDEVGVHRK